MQEQTDHAQSPQQALLGYELAAGLWSPQMMFDLMFILSNG